MTITLMIALNIVLGVSLLGLLAYVMSHPRRLTPHGHHDAGDTPRRHRPPHRRHEHTTARHPEERAARRLSPAVD
jgi:hypothetical protein